MCAMDLQEAFRYRSVPRGAKLAMAQALLIASCLYVFLEGWQRDLRIPFDFSTDALFYLMQSKSTVDNGWWWFNPMLGAPTGLNALAFPSNSNADQAIVWAISRVVPHAVRSMNLAWLLMVILSGLSASWCMRRLGASMLSSIVAGTLFALSPYAIYRNINHFGMVTYLVPFAATTALVLASGGLPDRGYWKGHLLLLAGCALVGFNYVYYAFFGCFFIALGALVGFLAYRQKRLLAAGGLCIALIGGSTILNLAPSLRTWSRDGKPTLVHGKTPDESEVFGLKIRQLVSPLFQHPFPLFRDWNDKEAQAYFPLENENKLSRLGFVGSLGFVGLLGLLLVPSGVDRLSAKRTLIGASQLTIAAVLLATIGGFGSLFNLFVSPEIRAYNRITPFIAFFSLTAVALALDALLNQRSRKPVWVIVLAVGLADQRMAAVGLNAAHAGIAAEIHALESFVGELEHRLPDGAMVLQLPFRVFLNERTDGRMQPYDPLRLYAVSHRIRWSYPALSNDQFRWQRAVGSVDPRRLPYQLAAAGFSAIVIDRNGYDDNAAAITAVMREGLDASSIIAGTERYIALDIRSLAPLPGAPETTGAMLSTTRPATLTISACEGQPAGHIDRIGSAGAPPDGSAVHVQGSGSFRVEGWAIDQQNDSIARAVDVVIDKVPFQSFYGFDRSDVAEHFGRAAYRESGFASEIAAETLSKGPHSVSLRVVSSSRACYYESPGVPIVIE